MTSQDWTALAQNGTYTFVASSVGNWTTTYLAHTITVAAPNPVSRVIDFSWATNLTYHETGLPTGLGWSVILHYQALNETRAAKGANVTFGHAFVSGGHVVLNVNGTSYTYAVVSPTGYTATPSSGNVTMPDPVDIIFTPTNSTNSTNNTNGTGGGGGGGGGGSGGGGSGPSGGSPSLLQQMVANGDWIWVVFVAAVVVLILIYVLLSGDKRRGGR
jgi:uncharacterized membrane protein YgcG